ncbi:hypothetical protein C8R48DRAFT_776365 [Suillus tomentosus]|nr:hypothetical protein C8R48DRAFT_776365 [Suillus tomentosus]
MSSRLPSPVSRLPSPVSRLPSPVSRLPSPVSRLPSPVSRLPSPVSRFSILPSPVLPFPILPVIFVSLLEHHALRSHVETLLEELPNAASLVHTEQIGHARSEDEWLNDTSSRPLCLRHKSKERYALLQWRKMSVVPSSQEAKEGYTLLWLPGLRLHPNKSCILNKITP